MKSIMKNALKGHFNPTVSIACIFALIFTFVTPMPIMAQNANQHGWETVLALPAGSSVVIKTTNEGRKGYKVVKVSPDSITVSTKNGEKSIPKSEIQWLRYIKSPNAQAAGIIVALAGEGVADVGIIRNDTAAVNGTGNNQGLGLMEVGLGAMCAGLAVLIVYRGKVIYWTD